MIAGGAREIALLGQNVNAYHGEGPDGSTWGLARLLHALADLGIPRLRYTTSHPRDMDDALIAAHRDLPALMPFLHLPVQSGSDRILDAMNRRHTAAAYQALVARVRAARTHTAATAKLPKQPRAHLAERALRLGHVDLRVVIVGRKCVSGRGRDCLASRRLQLPASRCC